MRRIMCILVATASIGASPATAEPDFYLVMGECKATLGYLGPTEESLATVPGDKSEFACVRSSQRISCDMKMDGRDSGQKASTVNFVVGLDSPPFLYFQDANGSDFFAVNLTEHRVVSISRFVSERVVGSKVCRGTYLTASELNSIRD